MESMELHFSAIRARGDLSAHDKFTEMRRSYKLAHPELKEAEVQMAIFEANPELHREYLSSNGVKR